MYFFLSNGIFIKFLYFTCIFVEFRGQMHDLMESKSGTAKILK
jgi:hypothetical protein